MIIVELPDSVANDPVTDRMTRDVGMWLDTHVGPRDGRALNKITRVSTWNFDSGHRWGKPWVFYFNKKYKGQAALFKLRFG